MATTRAGSGASARDAKSARPGQHREFAGLAAFFLADGSGFVNGEVIGIDGGEWLEGAGQFDVLEVLSDDEWQALRPNRSG